MEGTTLTIPDPRDVEVALDALLGVIEDADDDCGHRMMALPPGLYRGLDTSLMGATSLASRREVARWVRVARREFRRQEGAS